MTIIVNLGHHCSLAFKNEQLKDVSNMLELITSSIPVEDVGYEIRKAKASSNFVAIEERGPKFSLEIQHSEPLKWQEYQSILSKLKVKE